MDALDKVAALEKRLATAARKRAEDAEAAEIKRHAAAMKIAVSFPGFAAEVRGKLGAMAAAQLKGIPECDWQTRQHVKVATMRAFTETMLDGKERLDAARRGPGNRHERRAADKRQMRELVEWGKGFRGKVIPTTVSGWPWSSSEPPAAKPESDATIKGA